MRLADLTTLRLGGPAGSLVVASSEPDLLAALRDDPTLVLAGGSNVVVADEGVPGAVVRIATTGIEEGASGVTVAAGESWDGFVAHCVASGLAGVEALSGIPGSVGATPIQNVGAYGQEVADSVVSVRVFDRSNNRVDEVDAAGCQFGYRTSRFKYHSRFIVLSVTFSLARSSVSMPVVYAELARTLGVSVGDRAPL